MPTLWPRRGLYTPFREVYVQAAASGAGGALGAALEVWHQLGYSRCQPMGPAYLGTQPAHGEIEGLLNDPVAAQLEAAGCTITRLGDAALPDEGSLLDQVMPPLSPRAGDRLVSRPHGMGAPRLGHRSILGIPRRVDMKDILNLKINAESFGPSLLRCCANTWPIGSSSTAMCPT